MVTEYFIHIGFIIKRSNMLRTWIKENAISIIVYLLSFLVFLATNAFVLGRITQDRDSRLEGVEAGLRQHIEEEKKREVEKVEQIRKIERIEVNIQNIDRRITNVEDKLEKISDKIDDLLFQKKAIAGVK
jgi:septal ring factor EnvC (AmiA/AmiB activator)